jgi:hypothetical protein
MEHNILLKSKHIESNTSKSNQLTQAINVLTKELIVVNDVQLP